MIWTIGSNKTNINLTEHINKQGGSKVDSDGDSEPEVTFEIRRMTRDKTGGPNMLADEFIRNREAAMKRVISSRYGKLKYNFGGYLPKSVLTKKDAVKKEDEVLSTGDYLGYVNDGHWDFLLHVIIDERADALAKQRELEETARREKEEQTRLMQEKALQEKYKKREEQRKYTPGQWNPGMLDFLEEVKDRDTTRVTHWKRSKERISLKKANPYVLSSFHSPI